MEFRNKARGTKALIGAAWVVVIGAALPAWCLDLAKVNGHTVTDRDLEQALGNLNPGQRANILKDVNTRKQVLNSLIDQDILVDEAQKEKMDQDPAYQEALDAFRKQYLATRLVQKNVGDKLNEKEAKRYFERHKDRFTTEQVHAQHILVSDEARAMDLLKEAKKPGADFQALAEKYSMDPSAKNNRGDLGYFGRERMVPEFTDAAFAAKAGDVVGPVKTNYGYHIIKVIDKKPGKTLGFDEVELRVKNELRQELIQSYVDKLRKQAKIHVDDKAVEKM